MKVAVPKKLTKLNATSHFTVHMYMHLYFIIEIFRLKRQKS